jgi:DNA-binding transcriptional LysR family regulator
VDLIRVQAFLVVADELHFGRAAERLGLSQPRVSRLIAALEREVGGALFDRTTRRVRLTPLGVRLRDGWRPAYGQLLATLEDARTVARRREGTLRVGFTLTTGGSALTRLVRAFTAAFPGCEVQLRETGQRDPYGALRRDDIDVLVGWLAVDELGLTAGPAIERRARALAVSRDHPLAARGSANGGRPGRLRDGLRPVRRPVRRHQPAVHPVRPARPPHPGRRRPARDPRAGGQRPDRPPHRRRPAPGPARRHRSAPTHRPAPADARSDLVHRARERPYQGTG